MKSSMNKISSFLAAFALSLLFGACCLKIPVLSEAISARGNINLLTYAMVIILFCLLFLLFYAVTNRLSKDTTADSCIPALIVCGILLAVTAVFFFFMFQLEGNIYGGVTDRYIWHKLPIWLVIFFLAGEFLFCFLCIRKDSIHLPDSGMYLLYSMFTVLIGYTYYTPSIFVRGASDRLHANAYYNSIYNVLHGAPYTEYTTCIYGHYGILYRLPMKLLGGDFADFILLNSILGALCFLAMFLALHVTVQNNLLRFLGTIAMTFPILAMRGGYYWQLWPHRILFMSLMIFFAAVCVRFGWFNWFTCILGYIIALAGIVWNTESGLFCAIAWAGFWILRSLCIHWWRFPKILLQALIHVLCIVLCFFGAYGIVNLYNGLHGGSANSIREFLFPLMTDSYMTDLLRVDLPEFPSAYLPVLFLLFLAAAWGMSYMNLINKHKQYSLTAFLLPCFAFFTSVLTLGQMSYFMNRAAYHNLDICHLPAILLLCLLSEHGMDCIRDFRWKKRGQYQPAQIFKAAFSVVNVFLLLTLATGTAVQYGYNADLKTQFHNKQELTDFAANIAANVPKDTYAFGIGTAEIYSILRWDTQCYTLDFADLSVRPQVADYVVSDIKDKHVEEFLVGENTMKKFKTFSPENYEWIRKNYKRAKEFEFQGAVFEYYITK
ncbi:MAG: hypothetical protein Q4F24_06845 [Eubacteriales bacterium]|nr:hypothetical protein [Eubacteriales bacterium]